MTPEPSLSDRFSSFYVRYEYIVVLFFILIWQAVLLLTSDGRLMETDSYTHALRLSDFIQSGSWRETLYRHDNCPYGQILHFTRFTDMFLYVTTMPFLPFTELKKAVLYGCFLYNPVIACLSAVTLIWAGKAFFSPLMRAFSLVLYFTSSFSVMFIAGRPDHHVLLNLLLILLTGCLLHGAKTQKTAYYKTAGVIAGLSVWATPEGFLAVMLIFAGMVSAWLIRCQNMRQIRFFSQFFFISTAVCLIANPPMQGMFHPDNGRLSILMVVVSGLAFLSFYAEEALERKKYIRSFAKRFFSLLFLTSASLGTAVLIFGTKTLFSSPIPEELFDIWTSKVSELRPGYSENIFNSVAIIPTDSCIIGFIAFFLASVQTKKILTTLGIPLIFFTILTMMFVRFVRIEIVFSVFVLPLSIRIFSQSFPFSPKTVSTLKKISAILLIFAYTGGSRVSYSVQQKWMKKNDIKAVLPYLSSNDGCLLSINDRGPELAWLTGKAVIGTPYHSNAQGIMDNHAILNGKRLTDVTALLKKRRVTSIVFDNPTPRETKENNPEKNEMRTGNHPLENNRSFAGRLYSGKINACFIRPIPDLPPELKEKFIMFNVDFTACDQSGK